MLTFLALLALPAFAQGVPDADDADRVDRLTERLGVTEDVAVEITTLMEAHRAEMAEQRASVKATAEALKQARDAGDAGAIKKTIKQLRQRYDEGRSLSDRHLDAVLDLLTPEQQADWVLFSLRRRAKKQSGGLPPRPR